MQKVKSIIWIDNYVKMYNNKNAYTFRRMRIEISYRRQWVNYTGFDSILIYFYVVCFIVIKVFNNTQTAVIV